MMKFSQLPIGAEFVFKDENYTKVSPIMAALASSGTNKAIPRSAIVEVKSELVSVQTPEHVETKALNQAMQALAQDINQAISSSDLNAEQINALLNAIQPAFSRCRHSLKLP